MTASGGDAPAAGSAIVAFVPDLMDRSKVSAAASGRASFVSRVEDLVTAVDAATAAGGRAPLVVVDLGRPGVAELLPLLAALEPRPTVVGFGSHVDREQLADARRAGADRVLARSAFFADLAGLLA
jgi:DNA-binding NarL/FixJ family response regulator